MLLAKNYQRFLGPTLLNSVYAVVRSDNTIIPATNQNSGLVS
jgi:hypothetical protein